MVCELKVSQVKHRQMVADTSELQLQFHKASSGLIDMDFALSNLGKLVPYRTCLFSGVHAILQLKSC